MCFRKGLKKAGEFSHHLARCQLDIVVAVLLVFALFGGEAINKMIFSSDGPLGLLWQLVITVLGVYMALILDNAKEHKSERGMEQVLLNLYFADLRANWETHLLLKDQIFDCIEPYDTKVQFETFFIETHSSLITQYVENDLIRLQSIALRDSFRLFNRSWEDYCKQFTINGKDEAAIARLREKVVQAWNHCRNMVSIVGREVVRHGHVDTNEEFNLSESDPSA